MKEILKDSIQILWIILICVLMALSELATILTLILTVSFGLYLWVAISFVVFLVLFMLFIFWAIPKREDKSYYFGVIVPIYIIGLSVLSGISLIVLLVFGNYIGAIISFILFFISIILFSFIKKHAKTLDKKHNPKIHESNAISSKLSCPNCGQHVRVPVGKGQIKINCPKCNKQFFAAT